MAQLPLVECRTCRKGAVTKQYIDFLKVGTNPATGKDSYIIYDHGTQDIHANKKACTYGCNTIIVWDTNAGRYRDLEGGEFHMTPCTGIQRYAEMAERQKDIIDPLRRSQMIAERANAQAQAISMEQVPNPNPQAPNPIAEQLEKAKSPPDMSKTISFMWEMIKEIDRKVDALVEMKRYNEGMAEAIAARFNSIDEVLATILTKIEPNQFVKGSDLLNDTDQNPTPEELAPKSQPSQEELNNIFDEQDFH